MADDISIGIKVTGGDDIVKVAKATVQLDSNVKLLSKTYDAGKLSIGAYYTGIQSQVKALVKMGVDTQKAKKYVSDLAKATIDASNASKSSAAATKAEATAVKAYAQARRQATEANARFNEKAKEATAVARANTLEEERLKNKFVEGYTAMNIYTKELNDLAVARKRGIIGANEQAAAVARLNTQMKAGTGVFANSAAGMQVVGKRANRAGVLAQQAGYQFGDFAVQVQSGTNPMVAFGQQATQLVGTFSMLAKTTKMISIFAGLGVIIPILTGIGAYLMRTAEAADEASDKTEVFENALSSARSEVQGMQADLRLLASGFENTFELTLSDSLGAAEERLSAARQRFRDLLDGNGNTKTPQVQAAERATGLTLPSRRDTDDRRFAAAAPEALDELRLAREAVALAAEELAIAQELVSQEQQRARDASVTNQLHEVRQRLQREAREEAAEYADLVEKSNAAYEDQLALALKINALGEDHADVARLRFEQEGRRKGLLGEELIMYASQQMVLRGIVLETEAAAVEAALVRDGLSESVVEAMKLAGIDLSEGITPAVLAAGMLATNLGIAYGRALAIVNMENTGFMNDEDVAMSGQVVTGSATDRYDRDTLLGMGYTEAYLKSVGMGPPSASGGGGGSDPFDQDAYLKSLQEEANFKNTLVGLGEAEITELERRREIVEKMTSDGQALNAADEERINKILATEAATRRAIAAEEQRQATFDMVSGHIETAFMAMVDGSKSVEDAFKGMLRNILIEVYKQAVAKPIVGGIMSFLGFKDGGAFSGGNVIPFANGGVVSSATMFPMAGNQTGVMGEAGPEAIMPLKRGANGKLGVQVQGGGENVVINQNFNFQANGDDSVKRIIAQAAPQIANMTKKSMLDDRRRGGQMKTTFG